jgi:tetratricopeptide (TPR) repeat protein
VGDLFQRAVAKMSMQQYEPALADFGRVLQLQPNEANAHVNVGRIYTDMNRVDLAMEHVNRALQINPEHPDAYFMRGILSFRMGQRAAAAADFTKAHSLGYPEAAAWLDRLK